MSSNTATSPPHRPHSKELFGQTIAGPLNYKQRRNPNWQEVSLEVGGQKVPPYPLVPLQGAPTWNTGRLSWDLEGLVPG